MNTSGFTPATGQQFKIIDAPEPPAAPTVTGTFATVQETGRDYDVIYNPTDVTLEARAVPPAARTLSLSLKKHLVAKGRVSSIPPGCREAIITLQRRKSGKWVRVKGVTSKADGSYKKCLPDRPGKYRARIGSSKKCTGAISPIRRHSH